MHGKRYGSVDEDLEKIPDAAVRKFLRDFKDWAAERTDIVAVILAGSYAHGTAGPGSDVDLVLLVKQPDRYLGRQGWVSAFGSVDKIQAEDWGKVTSLRVFYADGLEVEFGIAPQGWGADPSDQGDMNVIADGIVLLFDPKGTMKKRLQRYRSDANLKVSNQS